MPAETGGRHRCTVMNVLKKGQSGDGAGVAPGAAVGRARPGPAQVKGLGTPMTWPVGRTGCGSLVARSGLEHLARQGAGMGRGWGRPGARPWGRARRGDVRSAILALLNERPMHGYEIIGELSDRTEGLWRPSPGSIYPTLQLLEDEGLVVAQTGRHRRQEALQPDRRRPASRRRGRQRAGSVGRSGSGCPGGRAGASPRGGQAHACRRTGRHERWPSRVRGSGQGPRRCPPAALRHTGRRAGWARARACRSRRCRRG